MSKQNNKLSVNDIAKDIKSVCKDAGINPYELSISKYFKLGGKYTEWNIRSLGGMRNIVDAYFASEKPENLPVILDLKEARKDFSKVTKELADIERLHKRIEDSISRITYKKYKPYSSKKKEKKINRTVNLVLSDLHIGSDISNKETNHSHGRQHESRSLAAVVRNVCEYKKQYRDLTELNLFILGDCFESELHGRTSADLLHVQACRAIYLLTQAVASVSANFPKVTVYFAVGNHGRDVSVHSQRATSLKFNALETTVYYAIRQASANLKNVTFVQPMTPWVVATAQGHRIFATHGDTVFNVGNPGTAVNVKQIENQVNKINASLKDEEEYKIFIVGHVHQGLVTQLSNGAMVVINGPLVPPNPYANSLGIMESPQVQVMWESTADFPIGDFRFINVNGSGDDKTLDTIIAPFDEFVL